MPTFEILIALCVIAFLAGLIDSMVGGGGLIQTPLSLVMLPNIPVATVIGSLKIPAFSGTAIAAIQYLKHVKINWKLFTLMATLAFISAYAGSQLLTLVSNEFMKPVLFVILILLAIYTIAKKDFGQAESKNFSPLKMIVNGCLVSIVIGFYDGFIGPATGTFFLLGMVTLLGMDFLHANAYAKMINLATNAGSILLFVIKGKIIWGIAIPMAVCNALGGYIGAKFALKRGNKTIRTVFIVVILISIARFGYEII